MASIHQRVNRDGSITHRVLYRIDGKQAQDSFTNPEGAERYKRLVERIGGAQARRVLDARNKSDNGAPTLREWMATYLDPESGILTGIEGLTRRDYERIAERSFLQVLGDYPLDAITKTDVGKWIEWQNSHVTQRGTKITAKTISNYHGLLSSALAAAVEERIIETNVAHKTRLPQGRRKSPVFLTHAQFNSILFFVPQWYKPLALFLVGTGARWSEATALTWADIQTEMTPPLVTIDKAWKRQAEGSPIVSMPKSKRANRTLSIWGDLLDAIGPQRSPESLVFTSRYTNNRQTPSVFREMWDKAAKQAMDPDLCEKHGLSLVTRKPRLHDLRHTHASWLIAAGAPLPFVQNRLGHESITTTVNIYGHLLPDAHTQMADIMANQMSSTFTPIAEIAQMELAA